jgi:hypothetical protein
MMIMVLMGSMYSDCVLLLIVTFVHVEMAR